LGVVLEHFIIIYQGLLLDFAVGWWLIEIQLLVEGIINATADGFFFFRLRRYRWLILL